MSLRNSSGAAVARAWFYANWQYAGLVAAIGSHAMIVAVVLSRVRSQSKMPFAAGK